MNSNRFVVRVDGKWGVLNEGSSSVLETYDTENDAIRASGSICIPTNLSRKKLPNTKSQKVYDSYLFE